MGMKSNGNGRHHRVCTVCSKRECDAWVVAAQRTGEQGSGCCCCAVAARRPRPHDTRETTVAAWFVAHPNQRRRRPPPPLPRNAFTTVYCPVLGVESMLIAERFPSLRTRPGGIQKKAKLCRRGVRREGERAKQQPPARVTDLKTGATAVHACGPRLGQSPKPCARRGKVVGGQEIGRLGA
jgi:hypothetical protein